MAGIGFELRKLLDRGTFWSGARAYAYAGLIGSGPWVLSILGMLLVGILCASIVVPPSLVTQFQTTVTYLVAGSLIASGGLQLVLTRYCADRLFERRPQRVLPALHGTLALLLPLATLAGVGVALWLPEVSGLYLVLALACWVALCAVWMLAVLLSGLKRYRALVALFAAGYGSTVLLAYPFSLLGWGLEGLLAAFLIGQLILLGGLWQVIVRGYPSAHWVGLDWLRQPRFYPSLWLAGTAFNLAVWADKFIFWLAPGTSVEVISVLRSSPVYDVPVFLAYLAIVPGMAIFLVRIETDFVEYYDKYYDAVRGGGSLTHIQTLRDEMILTVRTGLAEIGKWQAIATLLALLAGPASFELLGLDAALLPLFYVQVIGTGLQVMILALINVLYYFDRRHDVALLTVVFFVANVVLTLLSLALGPSFYGYGFAAAALLTVALGLVRLDRCLGRIVFDTFMKQP